MSAKGAQTIRESRDIKCMEPGGRRSDGGNGVSFVIMMAFAISVLITTACMFSNNPDKFDPRGTKNADYPFCGQTCNAISCASFV